MQEANTRAPICTIHTVVSCVKRGGMPFVGTFHLKEAAFFFSAMPSCNTVQAGSGRRTRGEQDARGATLDDGDLKMEEVILYR